MSWVGLLTFLTAFVLSVLGTWLMMRLAPRVGLIDHPAERKVHVTPTPLGGGVAIWTAVVATVALAFVAAEVVSVPAGRLHEWFPSSLQVHLAGLRSRAPDVALVLGVGTVVMLMGLVDDARGLSYVLRLVIEVGLVLLLIRHGIRLTLFPPLSHPLVSGTITVVWVVGLTNAFNFLDNMDGLSAGVAWISAALFCVLMGLIGSYFVAGFLLTLMGALGGFLCFNWHPAKIFMGDAGSNFVGFMIGVTTIVSTFTRPDLPEITIAAPLCVLAVPLYDSITVILIRLRQGRSPFKPDKSHFSHRLVALGMSSRQAVLTIYLVTLATGLGALSLYPLSDMVPGLAAIVVLAQVACLLGIVAVLESAGRRK